MRISLPGWAVFFLLGCRPAPPVAATPAAPVSAEPVSLCAAARARSRPSRELLRTADAERAQRLGSTSDSRPLLDALDFCVETPHGAWALSLERLQREGELGVTGRWVIAHLSPDGSRETVAPALPDGQPCCDLSTAAENLVDVIGNAHLTIAPPFVYDYDHDGEPELVVLIDGHIHEGGVWRRGRVWTYRRGVVALYPPAAEIVVREVRDIDRDGRPDLLTVDPFAVVTEWPGGPGELTGPQLAAHALPDGRFSREDPVAQTMALRACPHAPKELVAWAREADAEPVLDRPATAVRVACARLWGVEPQELQARIMRDCPRGAEPNRDCDVDALRKIAAAERVPLQLVKPEPASPSARDQTRPAPAKK